MIQAKRILNMTKKNLSQLVELKGIEIDTSPLNKSAIEMTDKSNKDVDKFEITFPLSRKKDFMQKPKTNDVAFMNAFYNFFIIVLSIFINNLLNITLANNRFVSLIMFIYVCLMRFLTFLSRNCIQYAMIIKYEKIKANTLQIITKET